MRIVAIHSRLDPPPIGKDFGHPLVWGADNRGHEAETRPGGSEARRKRSCEAGMAALFAAESSISLADERTVQLLVTSLLLALALLVAAGVIALVKRWRRQNEVKEDLSPNAQLAYFRSLREAGTISQEEFERLRAILSVRVRESFGVVPKAPPTPQPPETGIQRPSQPPETGIQRPNEPRAGGDPPA